MKNWEAIAKVCGAEIPARELAGVAGPLAALEETFRPLAQSLTPDVEPATAFRADEDGE